MKTIGFTITRNIGEEFYITPKNDENYLENTIKIGIEKIRLDIPRGEIVELQVDYSCKYNLYGNNKLKLGESIRFERESKNPVEIALVQLGRNAARLGVNNKNGEYMIHRKETFKFLQEAGLLEKEPGLNGVKNAN